MALALNTDNGVLSGTSHTRSASPCQDYALSGPAWGMVADGCSGGRFTDLGARIWALSLDALLRESGCLVLGDALVLHKRMIDRVAKASPPLKLVDALATLVAVAVSDGRLYGAISGDGAFIARRADKSFAVYEVSYSENMPLYAAYFTSPDQLKEFERLGGHQYREVAIAQYTETGKLLSRNVTQTAVDMGCAFFTPDLADAFDVRLSDLQVVMACTDGIFSRPRIARGESLAEIVGFKGFAGTFQRRRLGALGVKWAKDLTLPRDDLAIAAIHLSSNEPEPTA